MGIKYSTWVRGKKKKKEREKRQKKKKGRGVIILPAHCKEPQVYNRGQSQNQTCAVRKVRENLAAMYINNHAVHDYDCYSPQYVTLLYSSLWISPPDKPGAASDSILEERDQL